MIGAAVQIIGTGFSSNATENTVKFNGVDADIRSAGLTQLTVTVPAEATSGNITVTSPIGTATSSGQFTVIKPPVILDFNPKLGKSEDTVSISGTHFDSAVGNATTVEFSGTSAAVSNAAATSITTEVPDSAASGKISVANAAGNAR